MKKILTGALKLNVIKVKVVQWVKEVYCILISLIEVILNQYLIKNF